MSLDERTERAASQIVDAALEVHRRLGPGLLESIYVQALACELDLRNVSFAKEVTVPILYRGVRLDGDLRLDFLIDDRVVVEAKAVAQLLPVHEAQVLTYLKIVDRRLGFLINFNSALLKHGLKRFAL